MSNSRDFSKKVSALERLLMEKRKFLCRDFSRFRKQYFKGYHRCADAPFHQDIAETLMRASRKRGARVAIAAPRESAKSTIVTLEFIVYCICYRLEKFIVIVSSTKDQAVSFLRNIKDEFQSNDELRRDFPEIFSDAGDAKKSRLAQEEIITSTGIQIMARGSGQSIRGFRNREDRPSLVVLDDIETNEGVQTPESYYKLEDWVTKAVFKAGTSETNIIYVGTIHHHASLLAKFTDPGQYPGWEQKIYRSVISWAENNKLWEEWRRIFRLLELYCDETGECGALKFFEDNKEEMLKGTQVLWPESKSYYQLMVLKEKEGDLSFNSEMQNNPVNERDAHFNLEECQYWDDQYDSAEDLVRYLRSKGLVSIVGSCDPSMGVVRGDRSAIITIIKDHSDGRMYVVDADMTRRKPDVILSDVLAYHGLRNYEHFAFEANQAQAFMASELEKRAKDSGRVLRVIPVQHSKIDKITRIQGLQVLIKSGMLMLSRRHLTLLEEMRFFPKGAHDDGLDALEMAVDIARGISVGTGCPQVYQLHSCSYPELDGVSQAGDVGYIQVHSTDRDRFVPPEFYNEGKEFFNAQTINMPLFQAPPQKPIIHW